MTKIFLSVLVLLSVAGTQSFACDTTKTPRPRCVTSKKTKNYLTDKYMKMINLEGVQVTNIHTGETLVLNKDKVKVSNNLSDETLAKITGEAQSKPLSKIYEAGVVSSRNNLYVYVGKKPAKDPSKAKYSLNVVVTFNNGEVFAVILPIVEARVGKLTLEAGTAHEPETAEATIKNGTFWPY